MADHLSIEILGLVRGAADGPLGITMLAAIVVAALIAIPARTPLWWRRRWQPPEPASQRTEIERNL
jgi:uncharacterized integral membrane protein